MEVVDLHQHSPEYPGGPCRKCAYLWPCWERQFASLAEFHGRPEELLAYMSDWLAMAFPELKRRGLEPDPELEARHLGWIELVAPGEVR
jgi:hypothetical protein